MGEFNVNKSDGSLEQTAGMPSEYPATQVMLSDGVTSVEDALDEIAESLNEYVEITNSGNETLSHMLDRLFAAIDVTKITRKSMLVISDLLIYQLVVKQSSMLRYSQASMVTTNNSFSVTGIVLQSSGSTACQSSTGATGATSFNVFSTRTTDTSVKLYY